MSHCYACGAEATRACSRCGKFCCESHVTWFHTLKGAGAVCTSCRTFGCVLSLVGLIVVGILALVFFSQIGVELFR
jgi:hypothetical protein